LFLIVAVIKDPKNTFSFGFSFFRTDCGCPNLEGPDPHEEFQKRLAEAGAVKVSAEKIGKFEKAEQVVPEATPVVPKEAPVVQESAPVVPKPKIAD
jgi:hypothetical protein